jgi:hypothetical protein
MTDNDSCLLTARTRTPWNKGKTDYSTLAILAQLPESKMLKARLHRAIARGQFSHRASILARSR